MGIPDVLELTMVSARRYDSTLLNSACLISSRSTTASRIQSHLAMPGRSSSNPPVFTRVCEVGVKNGSGRSARQRSSPSRAASRVTSSNNAGTPALAKWAAICAPIVPAPSTATSRMCRVICRAHRRRCRPPRRPGRRGSTCVDSGSSWLPFRRARRRTSWRRALDCFLGGRLPAPDPAR